MWLAFHKSLLKCLFMISLATDKMSVVDILNVENWFSHVN